MKPCDLVPKKIENKAIDIKLRPLMERGIIPHPLSTITWVGASGSGKTNAFINMMLDSNMYKDFYDEVFLFSITGSLDPLFKKLNLDNEHIITRNIVTKLKELIIKQKELVENEGSANAKTKLIILEDITGNTKLLNSCEFTYLTTMGRHLRVGCVIMAHQYKKLKPVIRLNTGCFCIFPCALKQVEQLFEDYCPASMSKKQFYDLIDYAFEPEEGIERPFLVIDNKHKGTEQFLRKCWHIYLIPRKEKP